MIQLRSKHHPERKLLGLALVGLFGLFALSGTPAKMAGTPGTQPGTKYDGGQDPMIVLIAPGSAYRQRNLVSDLPGLAEIQDPLLVNPWGIALRGTSPFWVANAGTSRSTLYRGDVSGSPLFKNPGLAGITIPGGLPTGTVGNNTTSSFVVPGPCASPPCAAFFIFASITGNIVGWNPNAPAAGSTTGVIAASHPGRVYTGLAIGSNAGGNRLYAADFANGNIDVYDGAFALTTVSGGFIDPTIPAIYNPHNIHNIGGQLYVTYAKVGLSGRVENGLGNGYVRRFNTDGVRDLSFGINGSSTVPLDGPWGLAIAPASFGIFGGSLLVGNFAFDGGGTINAFNPTTGAFLGTLQDESGTAISNDGLWALQFGNGGNGGDATTLYFTAGLAREEHGLFGSLKPTTASATSLIQFSSDSYTIGEGSGSIQITVTRSGDASGTATVNYATFDESQPGHASQKSDYGIAVGTLRFNPGETSKTFRVNLINDLFVEGSETVDIALSNPTGAGVGLGSPNKTELTITDNDSTPPTTNPIDGTPFFVRQQYLDFLSREPDTGGFNAWVNVLNGCATQNNTPGCDRVTVSGAFFGSPEFQSRGYFIIRNYRAAYGRDPLYGEFMGDLSRLNGATQAESDAARANFPADFALRNEFRATLDALTNAQYVDRLIVNTGVTFPAGYRDQLVADLNSSAKTRAQVLSDIVDNPRFVNHAPTFNRAFVLTEYFGYLRRDPEQPGFNMWIAYLQANPGDFRTMVNGFVNSAEYRQRFGPS